jgi:hypothetical protein
MPDDLIKLAIEALRDMHSGWKYIRDSHGDLYGVGWDRAQTKAEEAIAALRSIKPDCRTCKHYMDCWPKHGKEYCTNGDKYRQARPIVQLYLKE